MVWGAFGLRAALFLFVGLCVCAVFVFVFICCASPASSKAAGLAPSLAANTPTPTHPHPNSHTHTHTHTPKKNPKVCGYAASADIWSFAITLLEMAHGHAPFAKFPPMKVRAVFGCCVM